MDKKIGQECLNISNHKYKSQKVVVNISEEINITDLNPVHLVTLACLVQYLRKNGFSGRIQASPDLIAYFRDDLHLNDYFSSEVAHVRSESNYNLNLWRICTEHALMYSQHVSDYLKKTYFKNKDLSALKVVLD